MTATQVVLARFWDKVDRTGECWEWTGCLSTKGYGKFSLGCQSLYAHRVSFALFVGPLAEDDIVMHTCDNRKCVRPSHLRRGDYSDNLTDCWEKGRRPIPLWIGKNGTRHIDTTTRRKHAVQ